MKCSECPNTIDSDLEQSRSNKCKECLIKSIDRVLNKLEKSDETIM